MAECGVEPPREPARPAYNEYQIANVVSGEIEAYRRDWSAIELGGYPQHGHAGVAIIAGKAISLRELPLFGGELASGEAVRPAFSVIADF